MRYLLLILISATCSFCNNESKTGNSSDNTSTQTKHSDSEVVEITPADKTIDGCYILILKRDTMVLQLQNNMNVLYGKLTFDNFEKDGSSGTVEGTQDGQILKLQYSFASEGMKSVMDVYFKADGDRLIRGIGDMKTKGDTAYFIDPGKVEFVPEHFFVRTPCEQIPSKYRL